MRASFAGARARSRCALMKYPARTLGVAAMMVVTAACGGGGAADDDGPDLRPPDDCVTDGVDTTGPYAGTYRIKHLADTTYDGTPYPIISAMPWTYTLSAVQCDRDFPVEVTDTHYIVDSNFELPYLAGVTDEIAW